MSKHTPNSSTPRPKTSADLTKRFHKWVQSFDFDNSSPSFDTTESTSTEEIISVSSETTVDVNNQTASFSNTNLDEGKQPPITTKDDSNTSKDNGETPSTKTTSAVSEGGKRNVQTSITCTEDEIKLLGDCLTLRSGKVINRRRSKSLDNFNSKNTDKINKRIQFKNNIGFVKSSVSQPKDNTALANSQINTLNKMENLNIIAQITNNIPFLWAEETPEVLSEVNTFVRCCENILQCLDSEDDKRRFMTFLPTKFRGRAARLLEGGECRNFDEIKTTLYNKLVNTKPYLVQLNELRSCRQFPGETAKSFGDRVNTLLKLCQQKAKERHTGDITALKSDLEETAVFAFKAG